MRIVTHRALLGVVGLLCAVAAVGIAVLWPGDVRETARDELGQGQPPELIDARLLEVTEVPDEAEDEFRFLPGAVSVEITARLEDTDELVTFEMMDDTGDLFAAGQRVRLTPVELPEQGTTYAISDFRRERPLALLTALFLVAVIGFGRWQGARALVGLGLTFVIIIGFIVPAILDGRSPVAVALFGSLAIMILTLYLAHGYSRKTTAAVVGTAGALLLTGLLAVLFVSAASITGLTSEDARLANLTVGGLSLQGLLLAGIIIGGLGVLDDVTMSQSSTVFELHRANPAAGFAELMRGALNVGRDHVAATVNTLFLAYAGAALPLLILFATGSDGLLELLTAEIVAVEVVRTLVGSLGLIAAVPVTTALAAALVVAEPAAARREAISTHAHGHVSPAAPLGESAPAGPQTMAPAQRPGSAGALKEPPAEDDDEWVDRLRDAYRLPHDSAASRPVPADEPPDGPSPD